MGTDPVVEPTLQLSLPARAENVIVVRQAVAGLGEAFGLADRRVDDLKTVVTEACNNVVVHAYEGEGGPLEVTAKASADQIEVTIADRGQGFHPRADAGESSLGIGLPLIASLADGFEISGEAGQGSTTTVRFSLSGDGQAPARSGKGVATPDAFGIEIMPGEMVQPVLARVIGALAARADFSVERLSDTVLLGDAVSAHPADDFTDGRLGLSIRDGDGVLAVRVGPLVEGAGERILSEMDLPGGDGSLRALARSMEVTKDDDGDVTGEFLVIEVVG